MNPDGTQARLQGALARATAALLAARTPEGHWIGELSSSALSTATAVTALAVVRRNSQSSTFGSRLDRGLAWLAAHANADGGWGDTKLSLSNLSTTALCWAAFGAVPGADEKFRTVIQQAEDWLNQRVGSLEPNTLALAIIARYGKDRTFSVPILTMCALAGRLGAEREAWRHVIPLPFELAACPHQIFAALRLPVVSYALPALIAIGQARHHHAPSRNPFARLVRVLARERTLRVLAGIQPGNGGFLEATPLTSFVTMSLAGSGHADHVVTKRGVEFLLQSQRADGSWPIDTNLATWLTTLAINALNGFQPQDSDFQLPIRSWLLSQQHQVEHPYTHAAPGGWAWTDLPGGVPDADDTAGALLVLRNLGPLDEAAREAAFAGIQWLLGLQNSDGGIPTFCRGWGALPFDRSSADITAHTIRAWAAWWDLLPSTGMGARVKNAISDAIRFLLRVQRPDGSWLPLWFGNQFSPGEENPTYGTARVLLALTAREIQFSFFPGVAGGVKAVALATDWMLDAQNDDGSWGGIRRGAASVEETGIATEALASVLSANPDPTDMEFEQVRSALVCGVEWLIERVESGAWTQPSPIGFYFAKLWYYEKLYPQIFTVAALNRASRTLKEREADA